MNSIDAVQRAIEYMEEHLLEPISYEDVAKQVYMSNYHFHRTFSMLTGITASEYLRNRRLSLAGEELSLSKEKVLDVALKYGYDSPESFNRAFTRFHGISPSGARKSGASLKQYNRLMIKLIVEGGKMIDYKIVERKPFKLLSKVDNFKNEIINDSTSNDIPQFWDRCHEDGTLDYLNENSKDKNLYGSCTHEEKESRTFQYGIGILYEGGEVPEGYEIWEVKPKLWAVFKCEGDTADAIGDTWDRIFKEFLPNSPYDMLDDTDFEVYPQSKVSGAICEIWVPVVKKHE